MPTSRAVMGAPGAAASSAALPALAASALIGQNLTITMGAGSISSGVGPRRTGGRHQFHRRGEHDQPRRRDGRHNRGHRRRRLAGAGPRRNGRDGCQRHHRQRFGGEDGVGHGDALRHQHLLGRHHLHGRSALGLRGRQSRRSRGRPHLQRRHASGDRQLHNGTRGDDQCRHRHRRGHRANPWRCRG